MGTTTTTTTTISKIRTAQSVLAFSLGSNLGDRELILRRAIGHLERALGSVIVAPFYNSSPISPIPQPEYLNTVVLASLPPASQDDLAAARALLHHLKLLEKQAGRSPGRRFGPRPLDIDLLLYGALQHHDPEPSPNGSLQALPLWLTLPHPRLRQRRFVLAPLNDLVPDLELPPDDATVRSLLAGLGNEQVITRCS